VGLVPQMGELSVRFPHVTQTLSVHSPFDAQRSELMPINDRFPLRESLAALLEHAVRTNRKVYAAYVLLGGVNDSAAHAEALASLCAGAPRPLLRVSLLRYHHASGPFRAPDE